MNAFEINHNIECWNVMKVAIALNPDMAIKTRTLLHLSIKNALYSLLIEMERKSLVCCDADAFIRRRLI